MSIFHDFRDFHDRMNPARLFKKLGLNAQQWARCAGCPLEGVAGVGAFSQSLRLKCRRAGQDKHTHRAGLVLGGRLPHAAGVYREFKN